MNAVIHFIAPNGDSADVVIRLKSFVWHCLKNFRHVVQTGEFTWICCFECFSSSEDSGACFPQEGNIWMDKLIFLGAKTNLRLIQMSITWGMPTNEWKYDW